MKSVFQAWDENILRDATVSGTPPDATYSAADLVSDIPAARVLYPSGTIDATFTLPSARTGHILVIPVSNADAGSAVVDLTNAATLSVDVPIPTMTRDRIPKTVVLDFSALSNLNSNVWHLLFTGNSAPVVLGGAIAIYGPKTSLIETDFLLGSGVERLRHAVQQTTNPHFTSYRQILRSLVRSVSYTRIMMQSERDRFEDIFRANFGMGRPGFLWPHPPENDGYFGIWQETLEFTHIDNHPVLGRLYSCTITFDELSKGQPV